MDNQNLNAISTSIIAFTGFLIGIFAIVYYLYQIKETVSIIIVITLVNIYILINLIFLYTIKMVVTK